MPHKTWDTKADFDETYNIGLEPYGHPNTRPEIRGHYERRALFNAEIPYLDFVTPEWSRILAHFSWPTNTSICIIGAGFGWSIEYLNSQGYEDVWGVDSSQYIQTMKNEIDPADNIKCSLVADRIHSANFATRREIKRFLLDSRHEVNPFDVCVTERVLTSLTEAESVSLSSNIRTQNVIKARGQFIHIESPINKGMQNIDMNWKTLVAWKDLLPNDIIVSSGGREVL